jgi:pimeloyl-ACP methyl ester carboxylesterase
MLTVADHLGIERAIWAGSSTGAWVVCVAAARWPKRVSALVLIDGGLSEISPQPANGGESIADDNDEQTRSSLGPGFDRLTMSFPSVESYLAYWKQHPAFRLSDAWNSHVAAYVKYDLIGTAPQLRSCVSVDAVRADSSDVRRNQAVQVALSDASCPVRLIRASKGALGQPRPHVSDSIVETYRRALPDFTDTVVPGTNHLSLVHSPDGAAAIAHALGALAAHSNQDTHIARPQGRSNEEAADGRPYR